MQPLEEIHLTSSLVAEFEPNGDIKYVYIFSAIAIIILLIACINFMNLSTARSANRAKEVGVRKVLGSTRSHLINQFLSESILLSFIAMIIALVLAYLALPFFNDLANKSLQIPLGEPAFLAGVIISILLIDSLPAPIPLSFCPHLCPLRY